MKIQDILSTMMTEFQKKENPHFAREAMERYGLNTANYLGLKNPDVYKIADEYFRQYKHYSTEDLIEACAAMLATGSREMRFSAFRWGDKMHKRLTPAHLPELERWMDNYLFDWADCDFLSTKTIGELFVRYPECIERTTEWASSKKLFTRRAAAVTLIVPVKRIDVLPQAFAIAEALLMDTEDLVQKGYGWLLKVAADRYPDEVFSFLLERKHCMPRTALRYAIEKMPESMRQKVLRRE